MNYKTPLTELLRIRLPLVVAPMAGGPSSTSLVAASCNSGALGSLGAAYHSPKAIEDAIKDVRRLTSHPFAVNLFISKTQPKLCAEQVQQAIAKTQKYRDEMNLPVPQLSEPYEENFDLQFEAVLHQKPQVLSFVFGVLASEYIKETKRCGIRAIGTATSLEEGLLLQESGVDAVVAQGVEAGGHRGLFDASAADPAISTTNLLHTLSSHLHIPVIAAGGIMCRSDIQRMLQAGAAAVQMGTAFLAVQEAGTSPPYRRKLLESTIRQTRTTRAFSGRLARGIVNRFMDEMDEFPDAILPFPVQNKFTRDLRGASLGADSADLLSLWAGTGTGRLWTGPVRELVETLFPDE